MTYILLTNDDGYKAIGFYPLLRELIKKYKVTSVVPDGQRCWIGKAITTNKPLELNKIDLMGNEINTCTGTPADCVQLGLFNVLKKKPRLVVSGINIGENIGHARMMSSGTVGAAIEASINNYKAIASSLYIPRELYGTIDFEDPKDYAVFDNAARITAKLVEIFIDTDFLSYTDLISINIPLKASINSECVVAKPFKLPYGDVFEKKGELFVHKGCAQIFEDLPGTDIKAIEDGKISVTPVSLDLVSLKAIPIVADIIKEKW